MPDLIHDMSVESEAGNGEESDALRPPEALDGAGERRQHHLQVPLQAGACESFDHHILHG